MQQFEAQTIHGSVAEPVTAQPAMKIKLNSQVQKKDHDIKSNVEKPKEGTQKTIYIDFGAKKVNKRMPIKKLTGIQ